MSLQQTLSVEEAFNQIMDILSEPPRRHYIAREVEKEHRKLHYDGRGGKLGILYTPIIEMAFGEHGFDHVIFETNTEQYNLIEKLRKHILDIRGRKGIDISTKRNGRNMIVYMRGGRCKFQKPLKVTYIFKEEWGL